MSDVARTFWGVTKLEEARAEKVVTVDFITEQVKLTALDSAPFDATTSPGLYFDSTTGLMASDGTSWSAVTTS